MLSRSKFFESAGLFVGMALLLLMAGTPAGAQVDTGAILGTVKDQSGAVVPGAKVSLTNEGTSFTLSTVSAADGAYIFTPVKIGTYAVSVEVAGFRKATRKGVALSVQQQVVVDFELVPGQITQSVDVTAAAPLLQSTNASVGQVVDRQAVNNLPLNGRNYTFLAQITAGVSFGQQDTRGENATGNFSANGNRPAQNDYLLDGIDNNSNLYDFLNGTNYVVRPPIDAIQEFKVQTSNWSAELGRAGGAVINATIKSGTNEIHGSAWEFFRNDKLDAANFFENAGGVLKGEFRQNQFGAAVGGPIVFPRLYNGRNKTFFFGDFEGTRVRQATPFVSTVPTALERSTGFANLSELLSQGGTRTDLLNRTTPLGTVYDPSTTRPVTQGQVDPVTGIVATGSGFVRDPFTGNQIPAGRLDPKAITLLDLYPAPNAAGLFNNFTSNPVIRDKINQFDVRVDHNFSDRDQMFSRISYSDEPTFLPGPFGGIADGGAFNQGLQTAVTVNSALNETHSFSPTLINEARLGYTRIGSSRVQPPANDLSNIPAKFGILGIPQVQLNGGLPALQIAGLNTLGSNSFLPSEEFNGTWQFTENLTKVYHSHTFKGGFEYQRIRLSILQPGWSRGQFAFDGVYTEVPNTGGGGTGLAQMLLTPTAHSVPTGLDNVGGSDTVYATNIDYASQGRSYYAGYFQDDWKMNPKLTLNLGLRWEYHGQFAENTGAQANLIPGPPGSAQYLIPAFRCKDPVSPSFTSLTKLDGVAVVCSTNTSLVQVPKRNFAPRVGFAYQATPKLVLRGGYGIFYGTYENGALNRFDNYPFSLSFSFFNPDPAHPIIYPNGVIATLESGFSGISLNPLAVNASGLQFQGEQFDYKTPYSQGFNFMLQYQVTPNQTAQIGYVGNNSHHLQVGPGNNPVTQILTPPSNPQNYVPYPDFSRNGPYWVEEGSSYYHSLQTTFERRFNQGVNFLANYTYSKCRSDSADTLNGTSIGYRAPWLPNFGIQADYGLCDFDIRNVAHFSGGYVLPLGNGKRFLGNSVGVVNQIVGGWTTNWILTLQDGQPFSIGCPIGTTAGFGCWALKVPGQNPIAGPHNVDHWLNPVAFANPAPATAVGQTDYAPLGGNPGNAVGPGFHRLDFSVFKQIRTSEKTHLEFRGEIFNLTNHPNFSYPGFGGNGVVPAPGSTDFTNVTNFGKISSTRDQQNDQREIQFALKFYF